MMRDTARDNPTRHLTQIPDLAAEVEATRDAPNPTQNPDRIHHQPAGSKPPTNLAALHATMPAANNGLRNELITPIQTIINHMADQQLTPQIPDWPKDTWTAICDWLTSTASHWQNQPWHHEISDPIARVHHQLENLARTPQRQLDLACPQCGDAMHPKPGGQWLLCNSGHQQPADLVGRYRRRPPIPESECAKEFGIRPQRIRVWRARRKIKPAPGHATPHYYPWDILLLTMPWLAEEIAKRDTHQPSA